jgi:hypothetical protein
MFDAPLFSGIHRTFAPGKHTGAGIPDVRTRLVIQLDMKMKYAKQTAGRTAKKPIRPSLRNIRPQDYSFVPATASSDFCTPAHTACPMRSTRPENLVFARSARQTGQMQGHARLFVRLVNQYPYCFKLSQIREYPSQYLARYGQPQTGKRYRTLLIQSNCFRNQEVKP